jgi:serine/threonine protein kinase, bacterial
MTTTPPPAPGSYPDPNWQQNLPAPQPPQKEGGTGARTKFALIGGAVVLAAVTVVAAALVVPALLKHRSAASAPTSASSLPKSAPRSYGAQIVLPFTGIDRPAGIAADNVGNVYVASVYNNTIWKLAAGSNTPTALPFQDLHLPEGVATDSAGNVYAVDDAHQVLKLAAGSPSATVVFHDLKGPQEVAADSSGTVYVTDFNIPGGNAPVTSQVLKLPAGSILPAQLPFTGLGNAPYTEGLAVDSSGTLYVADGQHERVLKLSLGDSTPTVLPFNGIHPTRVAVDSAGTLYLADTNSAQVFALPAGATAPTRLPFTGLTSVAGVAVDGAGNVYVADESGHRAVGDRVVKLPVK